jgi:UDP-3-O-[3-hydroxymyristoyl] glucosamine N-acyltransferase
VTGSPSYSLARLAAAVGAPVEREAERLFRGLAPLETAGPEEVTFLLHARYASLAARTAAGAIVVGPDAAAPGGSSGPIPLRVASPHAAMLTLMGLFHPEPPVQPGVHALASVSPDASVAPSASVGPFAVVETGALIGAGARVGALVYVGAGAVVGEGCVLHPRVVVRDGVRLGRRVIVHPGAVLGADGFGYLPQGGRHVKIPQVGGVRIEDDVEIGANSAVDRGTLGDTVVGRGTKIDNLVQVGHNCEVGEDVILVAQVGVSGSSRIGRGAMLAGQVGLADHATVGESAILAAQAGVISDVPAKEIWGGSPARPLGETKRIWAAERALPELVRKVRDLTRRLEALERGREA